MTKLVMPEVAYALPSVRFKNPKRYHLLASHSTVDNRRTVCGLWLPSEATGVPIEFLERNKLCKNCLGAIKEE